MSTSLLMVCGLNFLEWTLETAMHPFKDGSTALHQAAFSGSIEIVALLLSLGADGLMRVSSIMPVISNNSMWPLFAQDFEGRTPLHWCTNNHDSKCVEILLDKVVQASVHSVSHISLSKVPGLDVDIRDGASMTSLMWAAFHGRTEQVRTLLAKKADPALRDMDGMTAAHWSIQRHDTRVLQVKDTLHYCL